MLKNKLPCYDLQTKLYWYCTFKSLTNNLFPSKLLLKATQNSCGFEVSACFSVKTTRILNIFNTLTFKQNF